jgi:hypothetical protein
MALDLYDTTQLQGVIETLRPPRSFWLDLCFPTVLTFETEMIDFDVVDKSRRLAPFVAPTVQGKVMSSEGYTTKSFKPAYVKPKGVVDPRRVFKRRAGEAYTGSMSPGARRNAIIADILAEQVAMHQRRREWMAAQAIVEGAVTVAGENYPTQTVSFGRAAGQTITLAGAAQWGQAGVNPLDSLETWAELMFESSGYAPTQVIMGVTAWKTFRANADVKNALDTTYRGASSNVNVFDPGNGEAVQYRGTIGPWGVWTYNDTYVNDSNASQPMMDQKKVVMVNPAGVEGARAYGAIIDPQAGYVATEMYAKNWIENDPPAEFLMTQSAPLMIPTRPNATVVAKVLE